ncbi:hypothetical protein GCM10025859_64500 [Alicyclobacillus fastidiosus]|nr:hypothetical protein GCM10025859_35040 [Alicyclobacillus fastidiosus]GMA66008.1 hypothetical protein GCM10025859_64500 [Alicyclobacillus fastidiosus]
MEQAYCMKCDCLKDIRDMAHIFETGFRRIEQMDYPLGSCKDHAPKSAIDDLDEPK